MTIALSPFQRALVEAALKRLQNELNAECASETVELQDLCLWIDWGTGTVALSEKDGFSRFVCNSAAHRDAVIQDLKTQTLSLNSLNNRRGLGPCPSVKPPAILQKL